MTGLAARRTLGFTLLELMITISIIGILATIALPKFGRILRTSREGGTKGNLGSLRSALSIYYADTEGLYPYDSGGLTLSGRYLNQIPPADTPPYHAKSAAVSQASGTAGIDDSGGWAYSNDPLLGDFGHVWVNCTHTDGKGTLWTGY